MSLIEKKLLRLSRLGKEELKRMYLANLNGCPNLVHWGCIQMMKEKGYITQEEMDYIVL